MSERNTIFISKATPEDDDFVLWLAPKLEAAGYTVFADILELRPGERWRNSVTTTLQDKSIKMPPMLHRYRIEQDRCSGRN